MAEDLAVRRISRARLRERGGLRPGPDLGPAIALLLCLAAVGVAADQPGVAGAAKRRRRGCGNLATNSYENRREAAARLAKSGLSARDALLAGLQDPDLEVRRGCRRLLTGVLDADFCCRLAALAADTEGRQQHDIPCRPEASSSVRQEQTLESKPLRLAGKEKPLRRVRCNP